MGRDFRRLIQLTERGGHRFTRLVSEQQAGWTGRTIAPTITRNILRQDAAAAKKVGADGHIVQDSGARKTACNSTVLSFFGVNPARFNKCGGVDDVERILRNHDMSVKNVNKRLGLGDLYKRDPGSRTGWQILAKVPQVKAAIKKFVKSAAGKKVGPAYFVIRVCTKGGKEGHLIALDSNAANRVDTDPRLRDGRYVSHLLMVTPNDKLKKKIDDEREARGLAPIWRKATPGPSADDWKAAQKAAQERVARGDWTAHVDLADGSLARSMSRGKGR